MSKSIDYDKFCHCIICSENLLIEKIVNGKADKVISNNYDTVSYRMSDDSLMRVVVCKPCKPTLTDKHIPMIMEKVYKGWMKEIDDRPAQWTPETKQAFIDKYSKLYIKQKEK